MSTSSSENAAVLAAKLSVPRLRSDRVRRPRLVELLESSVSSRLVFIKAPAGFGKTTLIADWLAASRRSFAWLSVYREEPSADIFLARLEAALDAALGDCSPPLAPRSQEGVLLSVASRIADTGNPLVFVIDDFHNLHDPEGQSAVARLCGFLPEGAHLVIASREGIPFPAARLRASGDLAEIGAEDLRFDPSETREFLTRVSPVRLSDEDASALESRTEGWIAGLQLAALALRGGRNPHELVEAFGGTSRTVYDFLAEEALGALPSTDLDFLMALSVVDSFSIPLCGALWSAFGAGANPGEGRAVAVDERLRRLAHDCLFMTPLDDAHSWFRFHVLFREALLCRLRAVEPGRERGLRLAASVWFEANGLPAEALRQAVLAGDVARSAVLAESCALALLESCDVAELRGSFESIPGAAATAGPWFLLAQGLADAYAGELEAALDRATAAEAASAEAAALLAAARGGLAEGFRSDSLVAPMACGELDAVRACARAAAQDATPSARRLAGLIETLRAYVVWLQAESHVAITRAARALELLPPDDLAPRCHAEMTLANALYMQTADSLSIEAFERAIELSRRAGIRHVRYLAASGLANLWHSLGDLDKAKALCAAMIAEPGAERYPAIGDVYVILANVEYERDQTAACIDAARTGLELCRRWGQADSLVSAEIALAYALAASGDAESALELLDRTSCLETVSTWHKLNIDDTVAYIEMERGNRAGADAFCSQPQPIKTFEGTYTLAYWLILRRRPAEALPYIDQMNEKAGARGLLPRLAEGYVLRALASKARGEREEAHAWLDKALAIAGPRCYVRRIIRRGEGVAELLRERQEARPDPFVARLLEAYEANAARRAGKLRSQRASGAALSDAATLALSPREIEVLKLLGDGLTADEIAGRSFVAPSTVRSHVKSVYGKLGVHRRVEALRRATELGII
mgnify:CR=1 FL=1